MTTNELDRKARELAAGLRLHDDVAGTIRRLRRYAKEGDNRHKLLGQTMEEAASLIEAALRLAVPEWRPIETAPRDGTHIWLYEANDHPCAGYWYVTTGDDFHWEGWMYSDELLAEVKPDGLTPTHWQPLPAAPTLADEGGKITPCRCFTPRDKELCLHKRECSVVTAHSDEATP